MKTMNTMDKPVAGARLFSFGAPETVNSRWQLYDYGRVMWNGRWYEPACDLRMLTNLLHQSPYHESAIDAKNNILSSTVLPTDPQRLSKSTLKKLIKDYEVFGNAYAYLLRDKGGRVSSVEHLPALYMRRGSSDREFYYVHLEQQHHFPQQTPFTYYAADVVHLKRYDVRQEIYGVPGYLGALDAAWLNRESTLLKRRFFTNGAHLGFVFTLTAADLPDEDVDGIEEALKSAKGDFGNLFIHIPGEKENAVKVIPIGDIASKDDFWNVKITSRNDVLAQHRVPLVLMSIMPEGTGNLGKPQDAAVVFAKNEVSPLHEVLDEINMAAGMKLMEFKPYSLDSLS